MALDEDGRVFAWGENSSGQCGNGKSPTDLIKPTLIEELKDFTVKSIKCGYSHSVCRTACGRYYIWGSNNFGQSSLQLQGASTAAHNDDVVLPFRIDMLLKEKYNVKKVIDVDPGYLNTKIVVEL